MQKRYVTVAVPAPMAPIYGEANVPHQIGMNRELRGFGPFKKLVEVPVFHTSDTPVLLGYSDTNVDAARFSEDIAEACNDLDAKGYDVMKVMEVVGGVYRYEFREWAESKSAGGAGYGYSVTDGVIILACLRANHHPDEP